MGVFNDIKAILTKKKQGNYRSMGDVGFAQISTDSFITFADGTKLGGTQRVDSREEKKPAEVWELLKNQNDPIVDTSDLDKKIKIIKNRIAVLGDHVPDRDLNIEYTVLGFLEARKKYEKYKHLFAYPTTDQSMIDELCSAYKLKVVSIGQYSGTMPQEAIDELSRFKLACLKVRKDRPVVRLIVPDNDPKTEKRKRDPILLVSSPFGNWDYILGAWDKEVLIVDELIYMGK